MRKKAVISTIIAIILTISAPIVSYADKPTQPIFFDELTLLTNDELLALAEKAPSHTDTRPDSTLPRRKLTDAEFLKWQAEYLELGGINCFELEVIRLINEKRAQHRLLPLGIMPHYMMAARFRSQEMVDLNFFAHQSPVYGCRSEIIHRFGRNMGGSETLAGAFSPENTVTAWLNSPAHRNILLAPHLGAIGVGVSGNRTTAIFINGNMQYIGFEITINEFLGR